jgi:hypothetical protein
MSIDIKGTVTHIGETQTIGARGFQKRCFVLKTEGQYPQELEIEATKERIQQLDSMGPGDVITTAVNIKGRRWDGPNGTKYFVSLEAWKINVDSKGAAHPSAGGSAQDDIPFRAIK